MLSLRRAFARSRASPVTKTVCARRTTPRPSRHVFRASRRAGTRAVKWPLGDKTFVAVSLEVRPGVFYGPVPMARFSVAIAAFFLLAAGCGSSSNIALDKGADVMMQAQRPSMAVARMEAQRPSMAVARMEAQRPSMAVASMVAQRPSMAVARMEAQRPSMAVARMEAQRPSMAVARMEARRPMRAELRATASVSVNPRRYFSWFLPRNSAHSPAARSSTASTISWASRPRPAPRPRSPCGPRGAFPARPSTSSIS